MPVGIDYGMGTTNIDTENGIRFGVINVNKLSEWIWEEFEAIYFVGCPHCGNELSESQLEGIDSEDISCPHCAEMLSDGEQYGDDAIGHIYNKNGYQMEIDSHNDVIVTKSPYFTYCEFCSPCFPGGGHLSNPNPNGIKTYCLDSEWYDDFNPMEYPIFDVKN